MECLAGALARYADRPRTQSARANGALSASDESGLPVTTDRARTYWHVQHPELAVHLVVAARSDDEARTLAWRRWYGPEPTTKFEELLRAAFSATDSGEPAE